MYCNPAHCSYKENWSDVASLKEFRWREVWTQDTSEWGLFRVQFFMQRGLVRTTLLSQCFSTVESWWIQGKGGPLGSETKRQEFHKFTGSWKKVCLRFSQSYWPTPKRHAQKISEAPDLKPHWPTYNAHTHTHTHTYNEFDIKSARVIRGWLRCCGSSFWIRT